MCYIFHIRLRSKECLGPYFGILHFHATNGTVVRPQARVSRSCSALHDQPPKPKWWYCKYTKSQRRWNTGEYTRWSCRGWKTYTRLDASLALLAGWIVVGFLWKACGCSLCRKMITVHAKGPFYRTLSLSATWLFQFLECILKLGEWQFGFHSLLISPTTPTTGHKESLIMCVILLYMPILK